MQTAFIVNLVEAIAMAIYKYEDRPAEDTLADILRCADRLRVAHDQEKREEDRN